MIKSLIKKPATQFIGLDVGTRFIKAVVLDKQGDQYTVQSVACEAINGNAFAERDIKDFDAVSNALKKVKNSLKTKSKLVAVAISGPSVLSKVVYMEPDQADHELEGQIEIEADSLIPYPLDEVYLDFEELGPSQAYPGKVEVLLTAAHKDQIDSRITLLREAPFEPKVMDVEGYALGNALRKFQKGSDKGLVFCVHVGASLMHICVLKDGDVIYSKEHSFGMDSLIQDLSLVNGTERQQTEQALLNNTLPESWRENTYPLFLANLQQQINRAIQMYMGNGQQERPEHIVLAGGAANLSGLSADLGLDLGISVSVFNPFENMIISEKAAKQGANDMAPQLAVAAGLACRSFSSCHI